MQGILVFAGFLLLSKGIDTAYQLIMNYWQYRIEVRRMSVPPVKEDKEEEEEERTPIGFQSAPNNLVEVEDE